MTLFLSEQCPLKSYNTSKVVTATLKYKKLNKTWMSALFFHFSQASQDDSENKNSDLLSSFSSHSKNSQSGLGLTQGATEL